MQQAARVQLPNFDFGFIQILQPLVDFQYVPFRSTWSYFQSIFPYLLRSLSAKRTRLLLQEKNNHLRSTLCKCQVFKIVPGFCHSLAKIGSYNLEKNLFAVSLKQGHWDSIGIYQKSRIKHAPFLWHRNAKTDRHEKFKIFCISIAVIPVTPHRLPSFFRCGNPPLPWRFPLLIFTAKY